MADAADEALVGGRFRLGDLLGVGGTASVFSAEDTLDGDRAVAVKLLHERLLRENGAVTAFLTPARSLATISNENLLTVIAVSADDELGAPWIAMELAPGRSVSEQVQLIGQLSVMDALAITVGLLRGLEALHATGLVHRDVTPGNIMLDSDSPITPEAVRLIDFGLVAPAGLTAAVAGPDAESTGPTQVIGSVHYISPEQARGNPVDARGDLYQAGAVLHFLLTGRAPYPRDSAREVLAAHVTAQPPVPSAWRDGVPIAVDRIVTKAMAKTLRYRYASAGEMIDAVLAAGEQVASDPATETATRVFSSTAPTEAFAAVSRSARGHTPAYLRPLGAEAHPSARRVRPELIAVAVVIPLLLLVTGIAAAASLETTVTPQPTATSPVAEAPAAVVEPTPREFVRVPTLGATLAEAEIALAQAGLTMTVTREASGAAADTLIRSDPGVGSSIAKGGAVALVVASGENLVPAVARLSPLAAEEALRAAGFGVATMVRDDGAVADGSATGTDPPAGTAVALGSTIVIYLSTIREDPEPEASPTPAPTSTPPVAPPATG